MAMSLSTTYTGRVVSVNERGFKLDGHTDWLNVSKFAPAFELPERGATVTVTVDSKGFLRSCEVVDGPAAIAGASDAVASHQSSVLSFQSSALKTDNSQLTTRREATITRLAVLKAAAEFAAGRDLKSGDVLKIAESWERWILRPSDSLDLDEAF